MEQYFSKEPTSKNIDKKFEYEFQGEVFQFISNNGVFSKDKVDFGTDLLMRTFFEDVKTPPKTIVDAGCGIGIIGVVLGKIFKDSQIVLFDINERAIECSRKNAKINAIVNALIKKSDLFLNIEGCFEVILTNPPIRAGKKVVFNLYQEAYDHLNLGGRLYVVIQKKQGAPSSIEKLKEIFSSCQVLEKEAGYYILKSVKEVKK
jgi:16S rRNA (guanine1207-N2)-methyltransferase